MRVTPAPSPSSNAAVIGCGPCTNPSGTGIDADGGVVSMATNSSATMPGRRVERGDHVPAVAGDP